MANDPIQPVITPTMYCHKCWYILDGLSENRCPECGHPFDPADKHTYHRLPRRAWWRRTFLYAAIIILLPLAIPLGCLTVRYYWLEHTAITTIRSLGGTVYRLSLLIDSESTGGHTILDDGPIVGNVVSVYLSGKPVQDQHLKDLKDLTNMTSLDLGRTQVTDAGLVYLKGMTELYRLDLNSTQVTDAGLMHLRGLTCSVDNLGDEA